jgi:methionine--tRNA ligase beta chain
MPETAEQYIARIIANVGTEDPMQVLATTPARIGALIAGRADDDLRWTPAADRWSIAAIVTHLADAELVAGYRLRMILANPGTPIQSFDQNQWASAFNYSGQDAFPSLTTFNAVRTSTLRLLDGLDETKLEHYGMHAERGKETVRHLIRLYAGHDLNHLRQIERLLETVDAEGTGRASRFQPAAVKPTTGVDAVGQLDVRVGTVVKVDDVPGATRLARLTVDFGDRQRTIVAGIRKERSEPQLVQGQQALFVVNIPPRTIHGQQSEGMLFDIGYADGVRPALAQPEWPVPNGTRAG